MFKVLSSKVFSVLGWNSYKDENSSSEDEVENLETDELVNKIWAEMSLEKEEEEKKDIICPKVISTNIQTKRDEVGTITSLTQNDGVIDHRYYFSRTEVNNEGLDLGKKVSYNAIRMSEEQEWRVTQIYVVHEEIWEDTCWDEGPGDTEVTQPVEEEDDGNVGSANQRTIIGRVEMRDARNVTVRDVMQLLNGGTVPRDTHFNLDSVASEFTPLEGDIVSMNCIVEIKEDTADGSGDVLKVISVKPNRARCFDGVVTNWYKHKKCGEIKEGNNCIFFDRDVCHAGYVPMKDDEVEGDAIECDRRDFAWRAIFVRTVKISERDEFEKKNKAPKKFYHAIDPDLLKDKGNLNVQENTDFGPLPAVAGYRIEVSVTNAGAASKTITYSLETKPSNLKLISPSTTKVLIKPEETVTFSFEYAYSLPGYFSEIFVIKYGDYAIGRLIKWEVFNEDIPDCGSNNNKDDSHYKNIQHQMTKSNMMVQESKPFWVPGVRPMKAPSFVKVRIGIYQVPDHIRRAMNQGSVDNPTKPTDVIEALKRNCPELTQSLSSSNHYKRFHTLLFAAEVSAEIDLMRYTKNEVSFHPRGPGGEFLALEIPGLAEGRPSLIVGDSVVARNSFQGNEAPSFQGYVHRVMKNEVWLKFNVQFHNTYKSESYDVSFLLSRGCFRKCHAALDSSQRNQANLWLFPSGVKAKPPQVAIKESSECSLLDFDGDAECCSESQGDGGNSDASVQDFFATFKSSPQKSELPTKGNLVPLNDIEQTLKETDMFKNRRKELVWFNRRLNHRQKEAIRNILLGEARPLPYIIFGPPGTGKTMTLVETILQLYSLIGDSRILIATPSNSSANLVAERLLDSELLQPGDMVRLVAHHLIVDGKIPPRLVPYSATVDTNASGTGNSDPDSSGIANLNRQLILRHRITIGTCMALGQLIALGPPPGHYTHIVVDEAGQATEPEILIPLGFMAHESGQAILAGDPNQLGPVVQSKVAAGLGLSKSLLARLISRFPYQRDPIGFPESGGYDPRLVTRLSLNYRSLPDILELPSSLFYDSDLEPWISDQDSYEAKLLARVTAHLNLPHSAVIFHVVRGLTLRDDDSPSYWNPQENYTVTQYVRQMLNAQIRGEDIGIITPYQKQAAKIRQLLDKLCEGDQAASIKVGSVEEFQGQERMVIILSTVRSLGKDHLEQIGRNTARQLLGFVNNPERLNVAISRARALLIVCGDPQVLCIDHYWRSVVKYCFDRGAYVNGELPKHLLGDS